MFNAVNLGSDPSGRMLTPSRNRAFETGLIIGARMADVSVTYAAQLCLCAFYGKDAGDACALERYGRKNRRANSDWECQCRTWLDSVSKNSAFTLRGIIKCCCSAQTSGYKDGCTFESSVVQKPQTLVYRDVGMMWSDESCWGSGLNAWPLQRGDQWLCYADTVGVYCKSMQSCPEWLPLSHVVPFLSC